MMPRKVFRASALASGANSRSAPVSALPAEGISGSQAIPVQGAKPKRKTESQWTAYVNEGFGVSFRYPWIYTLREEELFNESSSLDEAPEQDGYEGQVALAQVEISPEMYPQTDFELAAFHLSANRYITNEECRDTVNPEENSKPLTKTVDGVVFVGSKHARAFAQSESEWESYVTFSNNTCYEVELALTASNEGFQRKADLRKIWARLDAIFRTLKIAPIKPEGGSGEETTITAFTAVPAPMDDLPNVYRVSWDTRGTSAKQIFLAAKCFPEVSIFQVSGEGSDRTPFPCGVLNPLNRAAGFITLEIENRSGNANLEELRLFAGGAQAVSGTTAFSIPAPAMDEHDGREEDSANPLILYADVTGRTKKPAIEKREKNEKQEGKEDPARGNMKA